MAGTFTNLLYHIVFSTKNRKDLIGPDLRNDLYNYIGGIIRGEKGALLTIGGTADHVHILARLHPTISISDMLRRIKAGSSKMVNDNKNPDGGFFWQGGYGAFSVSESSATSVAEYIGNQEEHHKKMTFKEEFILFLKRHKIEYDERYIWD